MGLEFKENITSRVNTTNLQRQLLHGLMADKLNLQRTLGKHKSEFFTNKSRLFIYDCIRRYFDDKHVTLTREMLEFEISRRYDSVKDKQIIDDYIAEYDIIKKTNQTEDVESIINSLNLIQLGNSTENLIREAYKKLNAGEYEEAAKLLRQKSINLREEKKEGRIISLHKDSDDWFAEVRRRKENPELYAGIPTGFQKFDKLTGGLFPAELTIVFGLSGKGKSTFMKALSCNIRQQGRVVLHCGNEENEFQMRSKYMAADSGERMQPFKWGKYTDEEYNRLKKYSDEARKKGDIYVYEFPQQTDATYIERAYRTLEMRGVHVDVIVVDYLDLMKPINTAYSENDEQGKVTSDLKQIAINCNCPVITATQAGTQAEKQEKKLKPFLTQADVFGTKRKVHSANTLIGIVNRTVSNPDLDEKDKKKHHMVLCVPKNRDGSQFVFKQVMDTECGKFYEDDDDDPVTDNMMKQAAEMIDESGQYNRTEIDTDELYKVKMAVDEKNINEGIKKMEAIANSINENSEQNLPGKKTEDNFDPLFSNAPASSNVEVEEENNIENENEDPFLGSIEVNSSNVSVIEESPTWESYNNFTKTSITEPSLNEDEKRINIQEDTQVTPEVPENENKGEIKLSDKITHKKSLSEILAEKKKK